MGDRGSLLYQDRQLAGNHLHGGDTTPYIKLQTHISEPSYGPGPVISNRRYKVLSYVLPKHRGEGASHVCEFTFRNILFWNLKKTKENRVNTYVNCFKIPCVFIVFLNNFPVVFVCESLYTFVFDGLKINKVWVKHEFFVQADVLYSPHILVCCREIHFYGRC